MVTFLQEIVIVITPVAITVIGTAIYMNRRKINQLYQRLFGLDVDDSDKGYVIEINKDIKQMQKEMNEQHRQLMEEFKENTERIKNIEEEVNGDTFDK